MSITCAIIIAVGMILAGALIGFGIILSVCYVTDVEKNVELIRGIMPVLREEMMDYVEDMAAKIAAEEY